MTSLMHTIMFNDILEKYQESNTISKTNKTNKSNTDNKIENEYNILSKNIITPCQKSINNSIKSNK